MDSVQNRSSKLTSRWRQLTVFWRRLPNRHIIAVAVLLLPVSLAGWYLHASASACPCNVFATTPVPTGFTQAGGIEVGFKFKSDTDGYITGVRFFKLITMTGVHTGHLWDKNGQQLATATFSGETASGWQEMSFSTPVAVTANTVYTASIFAADGKYGATSNYFTSDVVSPPLTAPRSGQAADNLGNSGQGVFKAAATSGYPTTSFQSTNYWVDVAYKTSLNTTPPTVTAASPTNGTTNATPGVPIGATFDLIMNSASLTTSTFTLKDAQNNTVAGTVGYDSTSKTASFTPTSGLALNTTYTATLKGGVGISVQSQDGIALATDYTWSFTITSTDPCPCSLVNKANPSGSVTADDTGSIELGVKLIPSENGYFTAVRFYKPIIDAQTTHTVNIWNSTGTKLATGTTANETDYGWQTAQLTVPLQAVKDQLYIASYGSPDAVYVSTAGGNNADIMNGPLKAPASNSTLNAATGSGNRNGVFTTSAAGNYPSSGSPTGNYYSVDAVFAYQATPTNNLAISSMQPKDNSYGVPAGESITATFDHALDASTVTGGNVRLFTAGNSPAQVAGVASYDAANHRINFVPNAMLANGQKYTMKLAASISGAGGSPTLGAERTWSFTVGNALSNTPNQGPGGPVLVITTAASTYSSYYAEILRTEGINYFDTKDITAVNSNVLANYDAVVLAEQALTTNQTTMLSDWVTGGGNLVAMRPDKKLASLLGLTDAGTSRTNQYLKVDDSAAPGAGIVNETVQFKGVADNYTLNGATAIAGLYSDASTATTNPAVTTKSVGSQGGTAAAFTYDLAKAVVALHQGNQAVTGIDSDGDGPRRSNDYFYKTGSSGLPPDWIDLTKLQIPQADEQQRLLVNVLTEATRDRKPLPRFQYLPNGIKAAMVFAGDDHNLTNTVGTEKVMNQWLSESPTNCSLSDWQCVRASHYVYTTSALTAARARQYQALGFEIGDHPSANGGCNNWTSYSQLSSGFSSDLATWRAKYTGLPNQRSDRYHCYMWSDWDSMVRVDADNGMRYDLNFVGYPQTWIAGRAPMVTGSGMNMRFTLADGSLSDVYQGVTNFDNTSSNATAITALLDNAVGPAGYYGIFGTHYDMSDSYYNTLMTAVKAHPGVAVISAEQALTWLDGRNSSSFGGLSGTNGQYSFTVSAGEGAEGLKAMMPMHDAGGTLTTLTFASDPVSFQTRTIKGVQYAVFDGAPGSYQAAYSDYVAPTPPPPAPSPTPTPSPTPSPTPMPTPTPSPSPTPSTTTEPQPAPSGTTGSQVFGATADPTTAQSEATGNTSTGGAGGQGGVTLTTPAKQSATKASDKRLDSQSRSWTSVAFLVGGGVGLVAVAAAAGFWLISRRRSTAGSE